MSDEIWQVVKRLNEASRNTDVDAIRALTVPQMVMVPPGMQQRLVGRALYIKSVEEFSSRGSVLTCQEHDPHVDVFGDTAVITNRYESVWQSGDGDPVAETGHDLVVLARGDEGWRMAWRMLMPETE